jgi:CRISPR type IV-associated protein Csf3
MQPTKITFRFASPVVVDSEYPIHLDALLAAAVVKEAEGNGLENAWSQGDVLPLATYANNISNWGWKASRLIFTPAAPRELVNMQRKSDPEAFYRDFDEGLWGFPAAASNKKTQDNDGSVALLDKTPPKINTQSGQFRAYQYYVSTQWMEKAEAWCICDKAEVSRLLNTLTHVGKMGRNGWGLISGITVEKCPEAEIKWALRVLPPEVEGVEGVDYAPVMSPPRAPYWKKQACVEMREPVV